MKCRKAIAHITAYFICKNTKQFGILALLLISLIPSLHASEAEVKAGAINPTNGLLIFLR